MNEMVGINNKYFKEYAALWYDHTKLKKKTLFCILFGMVI